MAKMKTNKAARDRFKVTGGGKVLYRKAGKRHLLEHKGKKRKRAMEGSSVLSPSHAGNIKSDLIPYA